MVSRPHTDLECCPRLYSGNDRFENPPYLVVHIPQEWMQDTSFEDEGWGA